MLRDNPEPIGVGVGGDQTTQTPATPATLTPATPRPHQMKKWTRKPRNPRSAETRSLISLAIVARDEAAVRPTAKNKALREAAYMRVIVACEQMIQAYAQRFAARDIDPEDLTSTATLGLIEALNRFNDTKSGGGWTGYVGAWMHWKLQQYTGSTRTHKLHTLPLREYENGSKTHVALLNGAVTDASHASQWGYKANERGAE